MNGEVGPFKSGLFHLSRLRPDAELIPVYLENLNRILPKGEALPVPMLSRVVFGPGVHTSVDEDKRAFLARARAALIQLRADVVTLFQDTALVALVGGVLTLLVLASIAGWILSRRVTSGAGRATVDNINARIRAWWVMTVIFVVAVTTGTVGVDPALQRHLLPGAPGVRHARATQAGRSPGALLVLLRRHAASVLL